MGDIGRRLRSVWRALRRSKQLDADMHEEMRLHIQMEAERLHRVEGLDPQEARRRAHVSFGGVEKYKEEGREARGFSWLDSLSLDARLGIRMLAKHRWLTLVGGVAMAVAIAIGASAFIIIGVLLDPALPLPQGDRIVTVKYERTSTGRADQHVLHAFGAWRDHLTTVEQLSAFRTARHNLVVSNGAPEPVSVAEITASAFGLAQAQPLLGRYLLPSDEQPNAAPVVVIGYDAWRTRFGADPGIVGRTIQLAGTSHTIIGIMPEGFGFPIDHQFWIPLRLGLRFRRLPRPELYEIVGVVDDFPGFPRQPGSEGEPTVYHPAAVGDIPFAVLTLRFNGEVPTDIAERLRRIGAEIDPALQLQRIVPLSNFNDELRSVWRAVAWAVAVVMLSVLLLSAAGVHALMSFTIAQRTREIGIRSALGAQPRHLLLGVFGRALRQLSLGVLAGSILSVVVFVAAGVGAWPASVLLVAVAALMMGVASLAALGPARRSLRLPTVDALRFDG